MMLSRTLLVALVATLSVTPGVVQAQLEPEARVIVRFKPQADSVRAKALALRATRLEAREVAQTRATGLGLRTGRTLSAGLSLDERTHVVTSRGLSAAQLAQRLAADPEVEFAVVDQRRKHLALPNDPLFGGATVNAETTSGGIQNRVIDQWYLKAPSNTPGQVVSSVNAPAAWDVTTGLSSVIVAVLDTGVRTDHPDLAGKFVAGYDFIGYGNPGAQSTAIANDGGGADADPSDPGDWVSQADIDGGALGTGCGATDIGNSSWHGTRVSGLIAANTNNGSGMAGVGWGLRLMPIRVLGKCGGYDSDIIAGMRWAAGISLPGIPANANKAKVLNLSLGGTGSCSTSGTGLLYRDTINQVNAAGATIVVAAGNSAGLVVGLPGNCPGVVTVAALRHVGTKVGFSSIGPEVTISAPGGNCINTGNSQPCLYPMVSTTNSGTTVPVAADAANTGSRASVGTSFSAPIVSGIVGLMASVRPTLTSAEAIQILKLTARPFVTTGGGSVADGNPLACTAPTATEQLECYCTTSTCGAGMVNAAAAVNAARTIQNTTVSISPSPLGVVPAGQTVTLSAAAVGLLSGRTITSVGWTIVSGGGAASGITSGANMPTATVATIGPGTFTVKADLTDDVGTVYTQSLSVVVGPGEPQAGVTIGVTQAPATGLRAGQSVSLTASTIGLSGGRTIASTSWSITDDGGGIVSGFESGSNTSVAILSPKGAGTFVVRVDVKDSFGASYSQTFSVVVGAAQAQAGVVVDITQSPASGLVAGQVVTLASTVSGLSGGRLVGKTVWSITDSGRGVVSGFASTSSGPSVTVVPLAPGAFTLRADVTDSFGGTYSKTYPVLVGASAPQPGVEVSVAQLPATGVAAGQPVSLTVAVAGLTGSRGVSKTEWKILDGGGIVTDFASGATTATSNLVPTAAGRFVVRVDVTDSLGAVYSQTAAVNVAATVVLPPTTTTGTSGGGGGGGAASFAWLAALLLAALSLRGPMTRRTPQPAL